MGSTGAEAALRETATAGRSNLGACRAFAAHTVPHSPKNRVLKGGLRVVYRPSAPRRVPADGRCACGPRRARGLRPATRKASWLGCGRDRAEIPEIDPILDYLPIQKVNFAFVVSGRTGIPALHET